MKKPWYHEGLHFGCVQCGRCCTGAPGYVWVTAEEIKRLAKAKGMTPRQFRLEFVVDYGEKMSLAERPNYDCVMLEDGRCSVYDCRPRQCRTFPFWKHNIKNRRAWKRAARECPGVDHGRLYGLEEIRHILEDGGQTDDAAPPESAPDEQRCGDPSP